MLITCPRSHPASSPRDQLWRNRFHCWAGFSWSGHSGPAGWVALEPTRAANLVTWPGGRCTGHRLAQCDRVVIWVSFIQWLSFSIPVWFLDYIPNILVVNCAQTSRVVGWFSWRAVLVPAARPAGLVVLVGTHRWAASRGPAGRRPSLQQDVTAESKSKSPICERTAEQRIKVGVCCPSRGS